MDRVRHPGIRLSILVAFLVVTATLVIDADPAPGPRVAPSGSAGAIPAASPTAPPMAANPRATPRGKEIYKGHTLEEIRADPSLLAEILAEADYIRPVHGEPNPPLTNYGSDRKCPNHVECPSVAGGSNAFLPAQFALMEAGGSDCLSSFEGDMVLDEIDLEGMAGRLGADSGVLEDGRGWVGSIDDARQHFGGARFVAEDGAEHWFLTTDAATLGLLHAAGGPAAAALIDLPLADGRIVWYLGPRWFVSIPC